MLFYHHINIYIKSKIYKKKNLLWANLQKGPAKPHIYVKKKKVVSNKKFKKQRGGDL